MSDRDPEELPAIVAEIQAEQRRAAFGNYQGERLHVGAYDPIGYYHVCTDAGGYQRRIDLTFGTDTDPLSLVGCDVRIDGTIPYIEVAVGVVRCEEVTA